WVDGGHNPAAAKALAESFRQWRLDAPRPLVMVAAMMADKDMDGFFAALAPQCDGIWACGLPGNPRAAPAGALFAAAARHHPQAQQAPDWHSALNMAAKNAKKPCDLLVCGSLSLAGEVLAAY